MEKNSNTFPKVPKADQNMSYRMFVRKIGRETSDHRHFKISILLPLLWDNNDFRPVANLAERRGAYYIEGRTSVTVPVGMGQRVIKTLVGHRISTFTLPLP